MPMSQGFKDRLYSRLPEIIRHFGTPLILLDATGIRETVGRLNRCFDGFPYQEYFAVKANKTPKLLEFLYSLGLGFDCSRDHELKRARRAGARGEEIMFTSNNTPLSAYHVAAQDGGCILNLDDISFIDDVPDPFPDLIFFRHNPGPLGIGNITDPNVIGKPEEAKYGARHDQTVEAYRRAMARGATRFGIHTMVASNELDCTCIVETARGLLSAMAMVTDALGIPFVAMNIGGGWGIDYDPASHKPFDLERMSAEVRRLIVEFARKYGYQPALFSESGRFITGPSGVLVTTVINRMSKYHECVGVDATFAANPRPGIYHLTGGGYHHITVFGKEGESEPIEMVDVVDGLCENWKFAYERQLPAVQRGDILLMHDVGAHTIVMGGSYNDTTKPQELMMWEDGTVERIARAETFEDLDARYHGEGLGETLRVHHQGMPLIEPASFGS